MYQEKVINEVLHFKLSEDVDFMPFSSAQLTAMLISSRKREKMAYSEVIGKETIDPYNNPALVVWCGDEP